jgi:hypothetical protein
MVFDRELRRLRDAILHRRYVMTLHAEEEMEEDGLTILDVEACILAGRIVQRQKDRVTGEWKYGIRGKTIDGAEIDVIVKMRSRAAHAVIITTYRT